MKNTSAMSANKRELKNEVDDYSQVLSGGLSKLHSVNASDVLKYCSAEDVVGQTVSYGSLNGDFIEWTIIENTKQSVTMLSNEIVFHSPFDLSDDPSIVYKNSYIRQLLNAPQFMTKFFTLEEAVHITGISLPRQEDIAIVSNPDLNETYWMLSFSSGGDDTPLAMNNYGNIIGESVSKNLGVRLKLKISPDMNYDIIKVYEEQENNPPKTGSDTKKILTIAGGAVAAIALIVGGVFVGSKLIHKSSSDSSSKNDDIVVSDVLNGNTNDATENAVPSGAEITSNAVTEMDATSDSTGENATAIEEQTSPGITGRKLQFYPSDKIKDYPVYLEKLKDLKTNGIYREQNNGFFLCDINEDNVPELFATFDTEDQGILFAGSINSGELVTFAEFMGAGPLRGITLFDNGAIGITSAGNEGHGISYTLYDSGNLLNGQHESISYIYENGSLSYISYQNDSQEKHITEAEVEQIQKKYVEASYSATPVNSVIDTVKLPDNSKYIGEGYVITESTDLNMRSEPNSSSKVIASIPKNTKIDCYESGTSGWYITYYKGDAGYVSSEFVSIGSTGSSTVINGVTVYTCSKNGRINTHGGNLPSITLDYITGGE
ncbi:MAG: SH3 domain-containing protein, partial [Ruminococcus sp.]|nr:SH3 domain-containing protein [Ruminococcus sp.]